MAVRERAEGGRSFNRAARRRCQPPDSDSNSDSDSNGDNDSDSDSNSDSYGDSNSNSNTQVVYSVVRCIFVVCQKQNKENQTQSLEPCGRGPNTREPGTP